MSDPVGGRGEEYLSIRRCGVDGGEGVACRMLDGVQRRGLARLAVLLAKQ